MKIGYLTGNISEEELEFASRTGFGCLSVGADAGAELNANLDDAAINAVVERFADFGMDISALCAYIGHLDSEGKDNSKNREYFKKLIKLAGKLNVPVVSTNAFGDRAKKFEDNIPGYKEVFGEYAKVADDCGVRIAIENCPHAGGYPFHVHNLGYCPRNWSIMFDAVESKSIGLEFDPSHLLWLGVDYIRAIYDFGDRIYHFHLKDTEILEDDLYRKGNLFGGGWWRYRIPGWGEVDWKMILSALLDVGYEYNMVIEHEDPVFHKERYYEGLVLGLHHIESLWPTIQTGA